MIGYVDGMEWMGGGVMIMSMDRWVRKRREGGEGISSLDVGSREKEISVGGGQVISVQSGGQISVDERLHRR